MSNVDVGAECSKVAIYIDELDKRNPTTPAAGAAAVEQPPTLPPLVTISSAAATARRAGREGENHQR